MSAETRKARARKDARVLFREIGKSGTQVFSIIQCGLGDWAEGPVLQRWFPHTPMMAVEPIHRYCHQAWENGFRGPIVQAALWDKSKVLLQLSDNRTETSAFDPKSSMVPQTRRQRSREMHTLTVTLDQTVKNIRFHVDHALLWMDVEGAETKILAGAFETLKNVSAVICELKDEPKFPGWNTAAEIEEALSMEGFVLVKRIRNDGLFLRSCSR